MVDDRLLEFLSSANNVGPREIGKASPQPAHRVQHIHRALYDVGQMPPANARDLRRRRAMQSPVARQECEFHGASDHFQRRLDGASDGLDQRGLAGTGLAGQTVDLTALDVEGDVVDRFDVAIDAEMAGAEMRPQIPDRQDRSIVVRLLCVRKTGRSGGHDVTRPMPLNPLRGSMDSFIDKTNTNNPMNVMITTTVRETIHHQTPATIAAWWFAP